MSPPAYAENEYLMRCMVRTITVAEDTITPHAPVLISALGVLLARGMKFFFFSPFFFIFFHLTMLFL